MFFHRLAGNQRGSETADVVLSLSPLRPQVSVYLQNWSHVLSYVNKAESTPEIAEVSATVTHRRSKLLVSAPVRGGNGSCSCLMPPAYGVSFLFFFFFLAKRRARQSESSSPHQIKVRCR